MDRLWTLLYALTEGLPAMGLLLGTGVALSLCWGFPQVTRFPEMLKTTLGRMGKRSGRRKGGTSPFKALCTALAASIGTGNIAGVAGAIALGGPGAVFWMWVSAFFGMGTKYAEVTLAMRYRRRDGKGGYTGGPMYYIEDGLGRRWRWLAAAFSLCGAAAALGTGNMVQGNTVAAAVVEVASAYVRVDGGMRKALTLGVGLACAGVTLAALLGGAERIEGICALLVPGMAAVYIVAALGVIVARPGAVPSALAAIVRCAFTPQAALGGLGGIGLRTAILQGMGRGLFSHEAGLGSAPMAYAGAEPPEEQGLWGMMEVLVDTFIICTMTALVVLIGVGLENIPYGTDPGAALAIRGFACRWGSGAAPLVAACLGLFALSTMLAWGLYGSRCWAYLSGGRWVGVYRTAFVVCAAVGAMLPLEAVWRFAGILNGLMALPNLAALLLLSLREI